MHSVRLIKLILFPKYEAGEVKRPAANPLFLVSHGCYGIQELFVGKAEPTRNSINPTHIKQKIYFNFSYLLCCL